MDICIDVGNTTIRVGFYEDKLVVEKTMITNINKSEEDYVSLLSSYCFSINIDPNDIKRIMYCSVVPYVDNVLEDVLKTLFKQAIYAKVDYQIDKDLILNIPNPKEIGNDLIADLSSALHKYDTPCLIIDMGTATKILLLDKSKAFSSCVIMPGIETSGKTLSSTTAQLPQFKLVCPKSLLSLNNTTDCMNAGTIIGHFEAVKGLIARFKKELGYDCTVIITGGATIYIKELLTDEFIFDPYLVLDGLHHLLEKYY